MSILKNLYMVMSTGDRTKKSGLSAARSGRMLVECPYHLISQEAGKKSPSHQWYVVKPIVHSAHSRIDLISGWFHQIGVRDRDHRLGFRSSIPRISSSRAPKSQLITVFSTKFLTSSG